MGSPQMDYETIRRRVARRMRKRILFFVHLIVYLLYTLINIASPPWVRNSSLAIILVWGAVVVLHYIYAFEIWGKYLDRETRRELERLRQQGLSVSVPHIDEMPTARSKEKPKRDQVVHLTDDGELVYEPDESEREATSSRRNRMRK